MQCGSWLSVALTFIYYALTFLSLLLYAKFHLLYITKLIQNDHLVALIAATGIKGQTSVSPLWSYLDHTTHFTFPLSQGLLLSAIKGQNLAYLQENSYLRDVLPHLAQPVFPTQSHLQFHSSLWYPTSGKYWSGSRQLVETLTKGFWVITNIGLHL